MHTLHNCKVIALALSNDNKTLYTLGFDLNLIAWDLAGSAKLWDLKLKSGEPPALQGSRTNPQTVYALNHNCLYVVNNGKIEAENQFSFEARSFAATDSEFYIGDRVNFLKFTQF